ncbi:uncharacterized protein LOC114179481 isoform X2 [Vigna unguiculata]|uniref:uncharacterized protein LOC114179481 isoform X2 n=1 Tax=Vigna unguiculata TaxID=3917 RepID=UPI001016468B|nr:uncharacterized protein LOC114179481 isoform X2 [Vigna unguiculata]
MACRSMLRSGTLIEPILLRTFNFNPHKHHITSRTKCNNLTAIRSRRFHPPKPPLSCSLNQTPSSHHQEDPPPDTVFKAISEVSKVEESVGQTTNVVIGTTVTDDSNKEWLALDEKVNSYPTVRGFTAIGTGGEDFVHAMVVAVESVIQQPISQGYVKQKLSSGGKYVSVNIGPIQVVSSEQVCPSSI